MSMKKWLLVLIIALWLAVLIVASAYKLNSDGFIPCMSHLTNINWFLQTLFFSSELYALLVDCDEHRIVNVSVLFWMTNGVTWSVFWLVFLMIKDNANVLLSLIDTNGGPYQAWVVLNGNAVFHYLIVVILLIYALLAWKFIADALAFLSRRKRRNIPYMLLYALFLPLLIISAYLALFDIKIIYGITTPLVGVIFIAFAILLVFNVLPVFLLLYYHKKFRTGVFKRKWRDATQK